MARHFTLAALAALALGASAAVPFEVTTISNGKFAADTKWYTMQIHADGYYIRVNSTSGDKAGEIKLNQTSSWGSPTDLWCFTGSESDGFTIYNRAMGPGYQFACPADITGDGGSSLVAVKPSNTANHTTTWDFASSSNLAGKESYYISQHGKAANAINRRNDNLAFWTAGKDGGSSVQIKEYVFVPPFETTTIVNGEFAPNTKWYTMQIHSNGYVISTVDNEGTIKLNATSSVGSANDLWCATGSVEEGFSFYNRAMGPGHKFASNATVAATDNGGTTLVSVMPDGQSSINYLWDLEPSTYLGSTPGYFILHHGSSTNAINRRGENLAFWTAGKDAGSTVRFTETTPFDYEVNGSEVVLPGGATLSCEGGTASIEGITSIKLGAGTWTLNVPENTFALNLRYTKEDGTSFSKEYNFYTKEQATIEGPAVITAPQVLLMELPTSGYPVFLSHPGSSLYNIPYRIPSICTIEAGEHKGRIFSVNDYRYSRVDIGSGRIDLYISYSDDNGKTWSEPDHMRNAAGNPVAQGTGAATPAGTLGVETNLDCGFGDPASISDRETGEILVVACCGRKGFWAGRRNDPQPSARWWSADGGKTWSEPDYGQWEQIYALFDGTCANGYIDSQFVGSGRMIQSKYIKVGSHYRIYCVMSGYHAATGNVSNWVLYSDDFGHNWNILGGGMKPGVPSGADEPKCEELPDGSVLLAARGNGGGRNFNIFRYTNIEKAEGDWGTHINTNLGQNGGINACNGEIMILPVKEKATGLTCYLALQSYPAGPGRTNVSIAWLPLKNGADFAAPENFRTWAGFYQVSTLGSAYSTMTWQHDNKVGFMYEEDGYGCSGGYNEIYRAISIEEITGDAYEYCDDTDGATRQRLTGELLQHRVDSYPAGKYVGMPKTGVSAEAVAIAETYPSAPSYDAVVDFNLAMQAEAELIVPEHGKKYIFISPADGTYGNQSAPRYLSVTKSGLSVATTTNEGSDIIEFVINEIATDTFTIFNPNAQAYLPATATAHSQAMTAVTDIAQAGKYVFKSDINGNTAIVCTNPGIAGYPAVHMNGSLNIVNWTADAGKSQWYMELVDEATSVSEIGTTASTVSYFDLQGRHVASPRSGQILITSDRRKIRF